MGQVINNSSCSFSEKIHADHEKDCIQQTREYNPFPKPVLDYKMMSLKIGLDGYDNFFKQGIDLCKYNKKLLAFDCMQENLDE